jgi:hypothetical protein
MTALTPTIDATRVKRIICVVAVGTGLMVPLVVPPASEAGPRSRLSQALLGGTAEKTGVRQPRPDGIGSLGAEVIASVDRAMNAGSTKMRATSKR